MHPIMRTGPKGSGRLRPIGGDEALNRVVIAFTEAIARHGAEAAWPVSRDGLHRLTHVIGYSRRGSTI